MIQKYIKINGKSYPIKICQAAILQMAIDEGLSTEQLPAVSNILQWPVKQLCLMILHSIKVACRHEGLPCDLTLDHIIDAVSEDEQFQKDMHSLSEQALPVPAKKK